MLKSTEFEFSSSKKEVVCVGFVLFYRDYASDYLKFENGTSRLITDKTETYMLNQHSRSTRNNNNISHSFVKWPKIYINYYTEFTIRYRPTSDAHMLANVTASIGLVRCKSDKI